MLSSVPRQYLVNMLEAKPEVLDRLLLSLRPGDPSWDYRPDLQRYTLREIVAHLADWDGTFLKRMRATQEVFEPVLQECDPGEFDESSYQHIDPRVSLARYRERRLELVAYLRSLEAPAWERLAYHRHFGPMTLEAQTVLVAGHDGYHVRQVVEWLYAGESAAMIEGWANEGQGD